MFKKQSNKTLSDHLDKIKIRDFRNKQNVFFVFVK